MAEEPGHFELAIFAESQLEDEGMQFLYLERVFITCPPCIPWGHLQQSLASYHMELTLVVDGPMA